MENKKLSQKYLLIISCSQRKKKVKGKVRAWDLYDGVVFRMLKKIEREKGLPKNLDILILSAKYGFLRPNDFIEYYDHRLTKEDIKRKKKFFLLGLKQRIKNDSISTVFVCLGKDYLAGINSFEKLFYNEMRFIFANGGIGKKMSQLKNWLLNMEYNI